MKYQAVVRYQQAGWKPSEFVTWRCPCSHKTERSAGRCGIVHVRQVTSRMTTDTMITYIAMNVVPVR